MKKEIFHKGTNSEFTPCGEPQFSMKHKIATKWQWKTVTCKRCLKARFKK